MLLAVNIFSTHLADVFLYELWSYDTNKASIRTIGYCSRAQRLAGAWRAEQKNALRWFDAKIDKLFRLHKEYRWQCQNILQQIKIYKWTTSSTIIQKIQRWRGSYTFRSKVNVNWGGVRYEGGRSVPTLYQ